MGLTAKLISHTFIAMMAILGAAQANVGTLEIT
jgi:hypothetical protein